MTGAGDVVLTSWTVKRRRLKRRVEVTHDAVVQGLQVEVVEDGFGVRWAVRGYIDELRVYALDTNYDVQRTRDVEQTQQLAVRVAQRLSAAGWRAKPGAET